MKEPRYISRLTDTERYDVVLRWNGAEIMRTQFLNGFIARYWFNRMCGSWKDYDGSFDVALHEVDGGKDEVVEHSTYDGTGRYVIDMREVFRATLDLDPKPVVEIPKEETEVRKPVVVVVKGGKTPVKKTDNKPVKDTKKTTAKTTTKTPAKKTDKKPVKYTKKTTTKTTTKAPAKKTDKKPVKAAVKKTTTKKTTAKSTTKGTVKKTTEKIQF